MPRRDNLPDFRIDGRNNPVCVGGERRVFEGVLTLAGLSDCGVVSCLRGVEFKLRVLVNKCDAFSSMYDFARTYGVGIGENWVVRIERPSGAASEQRG